MFATAYVVRNILNEKFPATKFSVQSNFVRPYSGGKFFDLKIAWTDGPSALQVSLALRRFCQSKLYVHTSYMVANFLRGVVYEEEK